MLLTGRGSLMPVIKGVISSPTGAPVAGATLTLTSLHNRAGILKSVLSQVTTRNGEYSFTLVPGIYSVRLTTDSRTPSEIGVIRVYDDSQDGSLNDFLGASDIDLRPEALRRFEELAKQANDAATSARQDKERVETLAGEVQQNADAVADGVQKVERLASEVADNAGQVQQGAQSVAEAVKLAQQAAKKSAASAGESKTSADNSAQHEQDAQRHAQSAEHDAQQTALDVQATATDRARAEQSAAETRKDAQATAADRTATAESVKLSGKNAEASAQSANEAQAYRDDARQIVDGLNASNATTSQKGLVQLSSATDSDSEELAATSKAVKAVMEETQTRAPLDSPEFVGTPTTPTPEPTASGREIVNAAFVRMLVATLIGSAPETLDTLNELAEALGKDPNFAATMTQALAGKQPLNEILTSLSGLATAGNKLPYFSDKGVMALANLSAVGRVLIGQNAKSDVLTYLGLKGAAAMDAQGSLYDRTAGRLSIPGMFGFGAVFSGADLVSFDASQSFENWVKYAYPGRYNVSESGITTIPGVIFSGVVEVVWLESSNPRPEYNAKAVVFYGINGDLWMNRYWTAGNGYLIGWENLKPGITGIVNTLSGTTGNDWGDPAPGGLIFAAYQGEKNGDKEIKLVRGQMVSGARLGVVGLEAGFNPAGPYGSSIKTIIVGCDYRSLPGAYRALSGTKSSYGTQAWLGMFIRVA